MRGGVSDSISSAADGGHYANVLRGGVGVTARECLSLAHSVSLSLSLSLSVSSPIVCPWSQRETIV